MKIWNQIHTFSPKHFHVNLFENPMENSPNINVNFMWNSHECALCVCAYEYAKFIDT